MKNKILSNIMALAVLIGGILFCGLLYLTMTFLLVAFAKMNGWLAFTISGASVLLFAFAYGTVAKKLGIKMGV
jgi:hypothetical protein